MIDPATAHERRCMAVFTSPIDARNQGAMAGRARWDGSALWLDSEGGMAPMQIVGPQKRGLLLSVTPTIVEAIVQVTGYGEQLAPLLAEAEFIAFSESDPIPVGALAIPAAFASAIVPDWRAP